MIAFAKPDRIKVDLGASPIQCTVTPLPETCSCCCDVPVPEKLAVTIVAGPPPGGCEICETAELAMRAAIEVLRRRGLL